ncbi:Zonadhesin [Mizuhopecten yessoensis]|uniref:Zonadhesin n=1 Tax=Mizuhopecten yessoensis TaxID=6573 RepID=A0A210PKM2_MIZYE|nr:Zonadhesin [Mizuhopecten yessoensis]
MAEGCACDKGFVRNDGQCIRVQECGCKDDDGTQYQVGNFILSILLFVFNVKNDQINYSDEMFGSTN